VEISADDGAALRYRRLALEYHPDRHRGSAAARDRAAARMAKLNAAKSVLGDERLRRQYDYELRYGAFDVRREPRGRGGAVD